MDRYSAQVEGHLVIGDQQLALSKVAPSCVTLQQPQTIAASTLAQIVTRVDGVENRYDVELAGNTAPRVIAFTRPTVPF